MCILDLGRRLHESVITGASSVNGGVLKGAVGISTAWVLDALPGDRVGYPTRCGAVRDLARAWAPAGVTEALARVVV